MSLKLRPISDFGGLDKERVIIDVLNDCNAGDYVIADTTFAASGTVSNKIRNTFFLPGLPVKSGEVITVSSKKGTYTKGTLPNGKTWHQLFWNLDRCVWNNDGDQAILLHVVDRQRRKTTG